MALGVKFFSLIIAPILLGYGPRAALAVNPCEYFDGSGRIQLDLEFTESFGARDHLPTLGEVRPVTQIYGQVRPKNSSVPAATNETVLLRPWDLPHDTAFHNGTRFRPLEKYFDWTIQRGVMLFRLKRGIDREALDVYVPSLAGVTMDGAAVRFNIECTPDSPAFAARNFSVRVNIVDVNDNAPRFYNDSLDTNKTMKNFSISVKEGTPSGVLVFSGVSARDADEGPNALAAVFMHRHSLFELAKNSAQIRLTTRSAVHYEYFGSHATGVQIDVIIFAVDSPTNASMRLTSQIRIRVTISDDEDPPPQFEVPGCFEYNGHCVRPTYYAQGAGNGINMSPEPLLIMPGPIQARKQFGFGIRYSLISGEDPPYFSIDKFTGEVRQLRPIDGQPTVTLIVKATKWTDKFDPNLGRTGFALLQISTELLANTTVSTDRFVPWRVHVASLLAICAAWILTVLLISIIFALFQCWSKRCLCFADGASAGTANTDQILPTTQPFRPDVADQGSDNLQDQQQQQQQQQGNNDSTCTGNRSSGHGSEGATGPNFNIITESVFEDRTELDKRNKHESYSANSGTNSEGSTDM